MASLASDEQQPGQRRLSWSAMKSFVKNTKRRSVQRLVTRGNEERVTPEEQDFMDKKQKFKEFNQTVTKIRKHLVDMQSAITKLSTSITTLTDDEILLPISSFDFTCPLHLLQYLFDHYHLNDGNEDKDVNLNFTYKHVALLHHLLDV